jgi:hypothetical protein
MGPHNDILLAAAAQEEAAKSSDNANNGDKEMDSILEHGDDGDGGNVIVGKKQSGMERGEAGAE